jgi:hypothetical protein
VFLDLTPREWRGLASLLPDPRAKRTHIKVQALLLSDSDFGRKTSMSDLTPPFFAIGGKGVANSGEYGPRNRSV